MHMAHDILNYILSRVHYSYCLLYSLIIIYSYSSQFIIRKVMSQQLYALPSNYLVLDIFKSQYIVRESEWIVQIYFSILYYVVYRNNLNFKNYSSFILNAMCYIQNYI